MSELRKKAFISYSWDSNEHQEWVLNLAKDLIEKFGIDVILDQFELSAGKDLTYFMESAIDQASKVLVILTPNYKLKSETRKSGVGYETSMITQEIFESPITKVKFIPILRKGNLDDSSPRFLKSKLYHNMVDDNLYINKIYELAKTIYEHPLQEKPALGEIPDFSKKELDPVIDIINLVVSEEKLNNEINSILHSTEGVEMFNRETIRLNELLKEKVEYYKSATNIQFTIESNNYSTIIIHALGFSVSFSWGLSYSNTTENAELVVRYWKGSLYLKNVNYFPGREPYRVKEEIYTMDMDYQKNILWKSDSINLLGTELVQRGIMFIVDNFRKEKSKKFRK